MTQDKIRQAFERCAESYYEGDFAKYTVTGAYVNDQQQDDYVMFTSGYQACAAEMGKDMEKMREALERIATHKHINPDGSLNAAVAYSAYIAKEALALADKWEKGNRE
jgi:hypothetical protein